MRKIVKETNLYTIDEIKGFGRDAYRFAIGEVCDQNEDDFLTNRLIEFEDRCGELMELFNGSIGSFSYFGTSLPFVSEVSLLDVSDEAVERYNALIDHYSESDELLFGYRNEVVLAVNHTTRILTESVLKFGYVSSDSVAKVVNNVLGDAIDTFVNEHYETLRSEDRLAEYSRIRGFEFYEDGELYRYDD